MWLWGVGKSSVGFNFLVRHVLGANTSDAFVDLEEIGLLQIRNHA